MMVAIAAGWLACALAGQVPPPNSAPPGSESFAVERKTTLDREASRLTELAEKLKAAGQAEAAAEVRRLLTPPPLPDGASRFVPLPPIVPAREGASPKRADAGAAPGLANVPAAAPGAWRHEVESIRAGSANDLFALASRAAGVRPRHLALADACLRAAVERRPDHPEARRLLGYVAHNGGWATPFAVKEFADGKVLHPVYGWVKRGWVPHLEKGELPSRDALAQGREVWLPAAEADAQRRDFRRGWTIDTEHFRVRTNVPLSEAIAFGRHLEALHDLILATFADVFGERLPLAQRFADKALVGEKPAERHTVSYFASREEFVDALRNVPGLNAEECLGYYQPPKRGSRRGHAYFFRDVGGDLQVTATLYHEASHQVFFESGAAPANAYQRNAGNYWVFEGLGTYFETLTPQDDGAIRIGGLAGRRNEEARKSLAEQRRIIPLAAFVAYDINRFNDGDIFLHYQQASALTSFLLDGRNGRYREPFLDYVRDAFQGHLQRTSGRPLDDRLGVLYPQLEAEFLAYLKTGGAP
jgi:hypothetical protein